VFWVFENTRLRPVSPYVGPSTKWTSASGRRNRKKAEFYARPFFSSLLRKVAAEKLIRNVIHEDGGPLIHNGWEDEQRPFDSTCRKFYRFLTQPQR